MSIFDQYLEVNKKIVSEIIRKRQLIRSLAYEEDCDEIMNFIDEIRRIETRIKELENKNDEIAKHVIGH